MSEPPCKARRRVTWCLGTVFGLAGVALAPAAASQPATSQADPSSATVVPTPEVEGPLASDEPGTTGRNYPFLVSEDVNLAARGYVAEEFFYSGEANWYDIPVPASAEAPFHTAEVESAGHAYKTRMVVYRPRSAARFNGTAFVEWTNASSSYDNPVWWQRNFDYAMREGYAFVTVTAQCVQLESQPVGLRNWNPARYSSLHIPDDQPCAAGTPGVNTAVAQNAARSSYDIFAQGMQAVRSAPEVLGGLPVEHVIAGGHSRSGRFLSAYFNAVHPRAPVADGGMVGIAGQQIRTDLDVPVIKILSETELEGAQVTARQPDTDLFRTWWMTGTSHSDHQSGMIRAATRARDLPHLPLWNAECQPPTLSRVPSHHVVAAGMDALAAWVTTGQQPAHSPLPVWSESDPDVLVRDNVGNALGGIRVANFDVPTSTDQGNNPDVCGNAGVHVPFEQDVLDSRYPDHASYVSQVRAAAARNVRDGFLLPEDAAELVANAQSSIVGTGLTCGPLCANVSNFVNNPSTSNLRDHTQIYQFRGDTSALRHLDTATRWLAMGYTAAEEGDVESERRLFQRAGQEVGQYRMALRALTRSGRATEVATQLLDRFAVRLEAEIRNAVS
jgi:hypothetical protein